MPSLRIGAQDGTIDLPNGLSISPSLSQDVFRASPAFANARSQDYGTMPWIHYHFPGGNSDGKELLVSLCFYDQILVYVSLCADLYPPGPKDWSNYSLAIQATTKQFHDRLLAQMLGKPTKGGSLFLGQLPKGEVTLKRPLFWRFPWGHIYSSHDLKGGGTNITISYGNRKNEAEKAYRSRQFKSFTTSGGGPDDINS
jgi:hypothetical protein